MFEVEHHLLAAVLADRQSYAKLQGLLDKSALSEAGQIILKHATDYYDRDDAAGAVDRDVLAATLGTVFPSPKQSQQLIEELRRIPEKVSGKNVVHLAVQLHKHALELKLADALLAHSPEMSTLLQEYQSIGERASELDDTKTQIGLDEIFSEQYAKIPFFPKRLCQTVRGGLRPGKSILIFARPGAGKTLLSTNICGSLAAQGHTVLHVINEESARDVALRYLSLLASGKNNDGPTLNDMDQSDEAATHAAVVKAMKRAKPAGYNNVHILYGLDTLGQVRHWIDRIKPKVLVLDQVRNISAGGEGLTQNLEIITRALRKYSNEYGLIGIGVSQAGESAEGKSLLRLTDLDSSKTGAQGACDLMLGMGVTPELRAEGKRWISVCRNKISGVIEDFPIYVDEQHTKILNT